MLLKKLYKAIQSYSLLYNNDLNVHYNKVEEKRLFTNDRDTNKSGGNFHRGKHI